MSRTTSPRRHSTRTVVRLVAAGAALTLLAACGSDESSAPAGDTTVKVVATTNVYASIVAAVGGDAVSVSAILDTPAADPHSFEATPAVALQISDAQLLVMNGGGYDDFATTVIEASDNKPVVINAFDVSGVAEATDDGHDHGDESEEEHAEEGHVHEDEDGHDHGEFNEHVFYNLDAMIALSAEIAHELGTIDPAIAATVDANAAAFAAQLGDLKVQASNIGADRPGSAAVATEPVLDYLLASAGVENLTPQDFSEAVENETDPSVSMVADVNDLLNGGTVDVLVQNVQTSGPVIEQIVATATAAGVPVLGITETFPEGVTDYVTWISNVLTGLSAALDS